MYQCTNAHASLIRYESFIINSDCVTAWRDRRFYRRTRAFESRNSKQFNYRANGLNTKIGKFDYNLCEIQQSA